MKKQSINLLFLLFCALSTVAMVKPISKENAIKLALVSMGQMREAQRILAAYGPLGADAGITQLIANELPATVVDLTVNGIGRALALYWGMSDAEFTARLAAKGTGTAVRNFEQKASAAIDDAAQKTKSFFQKYF